MNNNLLLALCDKSSIVEIMLIVKTLFKIACYITPLLVIIISIIHIFKTVLNSKEEDFKEALKVTVKRVIAGLLIAFLPALINYVFTGLLDTSNVEFLACFESATKEKVANMKAKEDAEEEAKKKAQAKEDANKQKSAWEEEQKQKEAKKKVFKEWQKKKEEEERQRMQNGQGDSNPSNANRANPGDGKWLAHQKNSAREVQAAIDSGFWGIEVDINYRNGDFVLYHETNGSDNTGYKLSEFLDTCKQKNIVAILDFKSGIANHLDELINLVKSKNMEANTFFQTDDVDFVRAVHKRMSNARIVFLNSWKESEPLKMNVINSIKDYIEVVSICAYDLNESDVKKVHDLGLSLIAFSYTNTMYNSRGRSAATLKSWGVDYLMANAIDE